MAVKIGGFAAFCIAVVIAGGVERVVNTVCNRKRAYKRPSLPKQDAFWTEFSTQLEALRTETPDITPADLHTKLKEKLLVQFEAAIAECPDSHEVECFTDQFARKLDALNKFAAQ